MNNVASKSQVGKNYASETNGMPCKSVQIILKFHFGSKIVAKYMLSNR